MGKTIKNIPTSKLSRGLKLFQMSASIGAQALGNKLASVITNATPDSKLLTQVKQARKVAETLSQMKGAAMKLGQLLSIHGEHLLPKEVTQVLAMLQSNSAAMEYEQIEKVVKKELGAQRSKRLEDFSNEPIAAASIGQVHSAMFCPNSKALAPDADAPGARARYATVAVPVAVKVQYPGVSKSIDSDVDSLTGLVSMIAKIPSAKGFESVTDEIKMILKQETNYLLEAENMVFYKEFFSKNKNIIVPSVFTEVSTKQVLVSQLMQGLSVQEFAASDAPQEVRNQLGELFLSIFYDELFNAGKVQTDPNFANYKICWKKGDPSAKLVLLDFGAVKEFTPHFRTHYKQLLKACVDDDYQAIKAGAITLGFLRQTDLPELVEAHYQLVKLFLEPFQSPYTKQNPYRWAESDLPLRIRTAVPKFILAFKLRPPPRDIVFLNRKIAGIYFFLSTIRAEFWPKPVIERFFTES